MKLSVDKHELKMGLLLVGMSFGMLADVPFQANDLLAQWILIICGSGAIFMAMLRFICAFWPKNLAAEPAENTTKG